MTVPDNLIRTVSAPAQAAGQRIDRFLADALGDLSRERIKTLILAGCLGLARADAETTITEPSYRVKQGEVFRLRVPPPERAEPQAQDIALDVVYEDAHLIVIDKPPGLVIHPAPGNPDRTLVNALLHHCGDSLSGIGGVKRPGIVHRLDKDTSGLLVAAKTDAAHAGLAKQFARHDIHRAYLALVWGTPRPKSRRIEGNIGRSPANRTKMAVVKRGGREAVTRYRTLKSFDSGVSLVECWLETGRTHQIRVHMAHISHPMVGDQAYGKGRQARSTDLSEALQAELSGFRRQALHAAELGFTHPVTGKTLKFSRPPPHDLERLIAALESEPK